MCLSVNFTVKYTNRSLIPGPGINNKTIKYRKCKKLSVNTTRQVDFSYSGRLPHNENNCELQL